MERIIFYLEKFQEEYEHLKTKLANGYSKRETEGSVEIIKMTETEQQPTIPQAYVPYIQRDFRTKERRSNKPSEQLRTRGNLIQLLKSTAYSGPTAKSMLKLRRDQWKRDSRSIKQAAGQNKLRHVQQPNLHLAMRVIEHTIRSVVCIIVSLRRFYFLFDLN